MLACSPRAAASRAEMPATGWRAERDACTGIPVPEARCHRLTVSENQTTRRGRTISLRIVVLPATGTDERRGRRRVSRRRSRTGGDRVSRRLGCGRDGVRARRDIVLADQRGTGGSNPLPCQFYGPPEQPQTYFDAFLPIEKVRACRARSNGPPTWRNTRLRLSGGSRGDQGRAEVLAAHAGRRVVRTRLAMEYLRQYEFARPRGRARKSGDASDPRARAIRAIRRSRRSTAARRMSRDAGVRARVSRDPARRRGRSSTGCGRVR